MTNIILFIVIGIVAGLLSGFFGIGGGIVIVPALIYICGFSQLRAQGTSLAVLLPPVGLFAFLEYYKKGNVDVKAGAIICITVFIGAMIGGRIVQEIPPIILKKVFAVFMLLISLKMLLDK